MGADYIDAGTLDLCAVGVKRISHTVPQWPISETKPCERAMASLPPLIDAVASNSQSSVDDGAIRGGIVSASGNTGATRSQDQEQEGAPF